LVLQYWADFSSVALAAQSTKYNIIRKIKLYTKHSPALMT